MLFSDSLQQQQEDTAAGQSAAHLHDPQFGAHTPPPGPGNAARRAGRGAFPCPAAAAWAGPARAEPAGALFHLRGAVYIYIYLYICYIFRKSPPPGGKGGLQPAEWVKKY